MIQARACLLEELKFGTGKGDVFSRMFYRVWAPMTGNDLMLMSHLFTPTRIRQQHECGNCDPHRYRSNRHLLLGPSHPHLLQCQAGQCRFKWWFLIRAGFAPESQLTHFIIYISDSEFIWTLQISHNPPKYCRKICSRLSILCLKPNESINPITIWLGRIQVTAAIWNGVTVCTSTRSNCCSWLTTS